MRREVTWDWIEKTRGIHQICHPVIDVGAFSKDLDLLRSIKRSYDAFLHTGEQNLDIKVLNMDLRNNKVTSSLSPSRLTADYQQEIEKKDFRVIFSF